MERTCGIVERTLLHLRGELLDAVHVRPLNLHTERRLDARQFHVQPVLDGHRPGVGETGKLELRVHLLNQLFVGHARRATARAA